MADKSWMLNPKAIRLANECIYMIKRVKGVRLKLSQPDFLDRLHEYVEQIQSRRLGETYANLLTMAGVGHVIRSLEHKKASQFVAQPMAVGADMAPVVVEMIEYDGERYPRYRNGREFKGALYGIPRYR